MATNMRRTTISLLPEWEDDLNRLKQERFYNVTQSEMLRHLIKLGLDASKQETKQSGNTA